MRFNQIQFEIKHYYYKIMYIVVCTKMEGLPSLGNVAQTAIVFGLVDEWGGGRGESLF